MLAILCGVLGLLVAVNGNVIVYTQDLPHLIEEEFRDMPASFGPDLPFEGLRGYLVVGQPKDGCGNMTAPPHAANFTGKWIVLVARYNCNFEVKVRNAMAAGFDCAIVHNVNSSDLETMSAKDADDITIPSVFVSDFAGLLLAEKYTYGNGYYVMVNGDLPFNINTHLLLPFAVVVVLCLLIILIFMIVKCIKDRRRARRHRLPNSSLKKIPTCKFSKGDPYETCAICLDDYLEGDRLRVLPCAHAYHAKCVDPWLTQSRRQCPVCKRRVAAAGDTHSDSDTEPLLPHTPHTQGGTFGEQRENPFRRAARMMSRLRRNRNEQVTPTEETVENNDETEEVRAEDSAPLIQPTTATSVSERSRRQRRRRARSASARPEHAASTPPTPTPTPDTNPDPSLLGQADHSINAEPATGEIGVAALPVSAQPSSPRHVDL